MVGCEKAMVDCEKEMAGCEKEMVGCEKEMVGLRKRWLVVSRQWLLAKMLYSGFDQGEHSQWIQKNMLFTAGYRNRTCYLNGCSTYHTHLDGLFQLLGKPCTCACVVLSVKGKQLGLLSSCCKFRLLYM